jgi:hypothetical protein
MTKLGTNFAILLAAVFISAMAPASFAQAESMECAISVYTAQDMIDGSIDPKTNTSIVSVPLLNGSGDLEVQVHGETVEISMWKFEHTDMYNFTAVLRTPTADLPPHGFNAVAMISDYLYNDGPTKDNGWDLNPGPNATRFAYLNRQSGTFAVATKLRAALKTEGKWGSYPFDESQMDVQSVYSAVEFIEEQVAKKAMQPTDVVGLSTVFTCSLQK